MKTKIKKTATALLLMSLLIGTSTQAQFGNPRYRHLKKVKIVSGPAETGHTNKGSVNESKTINKGSIAIPDTTIAISALPSPEKDTLLKSKKSAEETLQIAENKTIDHGINFSDKSVKVVSNNFVPRIKCFGAKLNPSKVFGSRSNACSTNGDWWGRNWWWVILLAIPVFILLLIFLAFTLALCFELLTGGLYMGEF
jgi:hypothetical protein